MWYFLVGFGLIPTTGAVVQGTMVAPMTHLISFAPPNCANE